MTTVEVLTRAREILWKGWCQGPYAETRKGVAVEVDHPDAVRFCSYGALDRVAWEEGTSVSDATDALIRVINTPQVAGWNDAPNRKKREVIAAFDRAIKAASK